MKMIVRRKGGSGSGNFGHRGRPGEIGGSGPGGGGAINTSAPASGKVRRGTMTVVDNIQDPDEIFDRPGIVGYAVSDYNDSEHMASQYVSFLKGQGIQVKPGRLNVDNVHYYVKAANGYKAEIRAEWDNTESVFNQFNNVLMDLGYDLLDYGGDSDVFAVAISGPSK